MSIPPIAAYPIPPAPPLSQAHWQLNPHRAALLVHDMQNYFISAYELTASPINDVITNIGHLIDAADAASIPVYFSAQPPRQPHHRRGLLSHLWGPGIQTDAEAAIIPELTPRSNHTVITKWRYSAFERTDLHHSLSFSGRDQLIITGVYGHMGCKITATDAFMKDIAPFLISDAIADFTADDHLHTLHWISRRVGVVLNTASILHSLLDH